MNDWLIPTLTLLIGGVVSGAGTCVATRNKVRFDFDSSLRGLRIASYGELWKRLTPLAKYARSPVLFDADAAADLAKQLRLWYFTDGGIYQTVAAREQYFVLQDALARIAEDRPWQGVWTTPERRELDPATWEHMRICGVVCAPGSLRTSAHATDPASAGTASGSTTPGPPAHTRPMPASNSA